MLANAIRFVVPISVPINNKPGAHMQDVNQKAVQGSAGYSIKGLVLKLSTAAVGAVCCLAPLVPVDATAAGDSVSQLKFLQILAQLTGDAGQFTAASKPSDYIQWAKSKSLTVTWAPTDVLTSDQVAVTLVQLYGLNPRKYGGDYYRILEREGITVPQTGTVTGADLSSIIDSSAFASRTGALAVVGQSPVKPGNGQGFGVGWYWHNGLTPPALPPGLANKGGVKPGRPR
jgi:hypothetical protein